MTDSLSIDNTVVAPKRSYCRTKSTSRTKLEDVIVNSHAPTTEIKAAILPSGMAAISAVFHALFSKNKTGELFLSDELYCDTPQCAKAWKKQYGFQIKTFDVRHGELLLDMIQSSKAPFQLLFLESCSNPSGKMLDWSIITKLKKINPGLVVCVDNTWLTSVLFNPFEFGADIVVESMSKYRSRGKLIGGFVCCKKQFIKDVKKYITLHGMFIGADHCEIFIKSDQSLAERLQKAGDIATQIMLALDKDATIIGPLQSNHPNTFVYLKDIKPAVFLMHVESRCSLADIENIIYPFGLEKETSYGASYSKIDAWPRLGLSTDYTDEDQTNAKQGVWLRVSVGYDESYSFLYKNLQTVIQTLQNL